VGVIFVRIVKIEVFLKVLEGGVTRVLGGELSNSTCIIRAPFFPLGIPLIDFFCLIGELSSI